MQQAFVYTERPLDQTAVEEVFDVQWSEKDSNRYKLEQKAVTYWRNFLLEAECKSPKASACMITMQF